MKSHRGDFSLSYNWKHKVKLLIIIIAENYKNLLVSGIVLSTLYLLPHLIFSIIPLISILQMENWRSETLEIYSKWCVRIWVNFNARISYLNHHSIWLLLLPNILCSKDIVQNYTDYSTHSVVLILFWTLTPSPQNALEKWGISHQRVAWGQGSDKPEK